MKPKYSDNGKLCYTDTDSFTIKIKTKDFYKDIANDVEDRFDTSNYEVYRPLPNKTYSYLTDDFKEDKKAKGTKKCVVKRMIKFNDYKNCLLNDEVVLKSQQRFKSREHNVHTENINKIALK